LKTVASTVKKLFSPEGNGCAAACHYFGRIARNPAKSAVAPKTLAFNHKSVLKIRTAAKGLRLKVKNYSP
jgi:hypothetical protein